MEDTAKNCVTRRAVKYEEDHTIFFGKADTVGKKYKDFAKESPGWKLFSQAIFEFCQPSRNNWRRKFKELIRNF
jgi:hypothetical protein